MTGKEIEIESYDLKHLGIVGGIIDDIGLVEIINEELGTHVQENITSGQVVKAMILNGLGFVSAPMYLYSEFFTGKNVEELLGKGIKAEDLNDDKLGKTLDKLHKAGLTKVFMKVALKATKIYGVKREKIHVDASSMHVHGEYEIEEGKENESEEEGELKEIEIKQGYSRSHRPDLKQFVLDLMCSEDGDVPVFFRVGSGNEQDKAMFGKLIKDYKSEVDLEALFVCDAALYSEENLKMLEGMKWLSRVPLTIKEAKGIIDKVGEEELKKIGKGYKGGEVRKEYAGVEQRWIVVESEKGKEGGLKRLEKEIKKKRTEAERELKKAGKKKFACNKDAKQALEEINKELKYHKIEKVEVEEKKKYIGSGRPSKDSPYETVYQVKGKVEEKEETIEIEKKRQGRFVLATNELEEDKLNPEEVLKTYKEQQTAERGFRFLKDPLFFTSSVFLKTPRRIAALGMIMALCLLIYTLGQRFLHHNFVQNIRVLTQF